VEIFADRSDNKEYSMLIFVGLFLVLAPTWSQVSRDEVADMLNQMVKEKAISKEEAQKAQLKMKTMNDKDWQNLNNVASEMAKKRSPASVGQGDKIKQFDIKNLDRSQIEQIQTDLQKMVPDFQP